MALLWGSSSRRKRQKDTRHTQGGQAMIGSGSERYFGSDALIGDIVSDIALCLF